MPWVGIECSVESWELRKWAEHVKQSGGPKVADLLVRLAALVSGENAGIAGKDRMLEIESRAAAELARIHSEACRRAGRIMGKLAADDVSMPAFMSAAGMDGWRSGAAGGKNGGVLRRRSKYPKGQGVAGPDGQPAVLAEKGEPPLNVATTVARDRRYGETWEGWAGVELVKSGFKMRHVARGIGLETTEAWRHVSGWTKHWRREGLAGRQFPGPREGWIARLETAVNLALNTGVRGKPVKLNGTGDLGLSKNPEGEGEV